MVSTVRTVVIFFLIFLATSFEALADDASQDSIHLGFLHPSGVDVLGYTVEKPTSGHIYRFYTFGMPAIAAMGINYYGNYQGNGLTSTLGVGIGSVLYGSVAYQFRLAQMHYLKVGAGLTTGIAYTGSYPVFSYEYRL